MGTKRRRVAASDGMKRRRLEGKKRERLLKAGEREDRSGSEQAMESHGGRGTR